MEKYQIRLIRTLVLLAAIHIMAASWFVIQIYAQSKISPAKEFNHLKTNTTSEIHSDIIKKYSQIELYKSKQIMFDHVINGRGMSRVTFATGIPFVAVGEYAYGVTNRLTVGVLGGLTPEVEGYGVRVRSVIYQKRNHYRVYFCTPVIYYPGLSAGDPWWLTRPNINFEWVTRSNIRYKFGISVFMAASNNSLFGDASKATLQPDYWTSAHTGMSLPIGSDFSFQTEVSYVSKGVTPIKDFIGAPPVVLVLGISYTF